MPTATDVANRGKNWRDLCSLCEWPLDRETDGGDPCCYKSCGGCGLCTADPEYSLCFDCGGCTVRCCVCEARTAA